MLNKGDEVIIVGMTNSNGTNHRDLEKYKGTKQIIQSVRESINERYDIRLNREYRWYFSESEVKSIKEVPKTKYLVYNLTSHKSVNHMTLESALKLAQSSPQCEFQLYELKYNVVAKPVEVQYEAVEIK